MIRWIGFAGILSFFALLLGTDCVRLAPIKLGWLRECRDEVVSTLAADHLQNVELLCFAAYLIAFMVLRFRKESRANQAFRKSVQNPEILRDACLVLFCAIVVVHHF